MLPLPEELLLLSLDEEHGSVLSAASKGLNVGLAGAEVVELSVQGRLALDGRKLRVADARSTGDPLLDQTLQLVDGAALRGLDRWLRKRSDGARVRWGERLAARGIVSEEVGRVLFLKTQAYKEIDPRYEDEIRARLGDALLGGVMPDERTASLVGLVRAVGLVDALVAKEDRRAARAAAKAIAKDDRYARGVSRVTSAINAVVHDSTAAVVAIDAHHHG
jgi:golgi phosphoprotein 3